MKLGDILKNKSVGQNNPNRRVIYLREDLYSIYCLAQDGIVVRFYRQDFIKEKFLSVVGSLDLSDWLMK